LKSTGYCFKSLWEHTLFCLAVEPVRQSRSMKSVQFHADNDLDIQN